MFFEDSAALIGLLLAFAGWLHQLTGSAFWDGLASVLIAVLLTVVAYILGGTNKGLLIGRQPRPGPSTPCATPWPTGRRWSRSWTC